MYESVYVTSRTGGTYFWAAVKCGRCFPKIARGGGTGRVFREVFGQARGLGVGMLNGEERVAYGVPGGGLFPGKLRERLSGAC